MNQSGFWRKYGAADEMDHIGAWSNEKGELFLKEIGSLRRILHRLFYITSLR